MSTTRCFWLILLLAPYLALAQTRRQDSTLMASLAQLEADSTLDYDLLFRDFDDFMDSILSPRSYGLAGITAGRGYYNFENKANFTITAASKMTYTPMLGYYHKSGWGLTGMGFMVDDGERMNLYQASLTPSFDYLQNRDLATGISYTRFFTKDSLSFYTTPLQNELYAYFTWRKSWIRPMLALSYGWGSRSDYQEREELISDLRLRRRGFTYINTEERVSDFSVMASVRHDFYWLDVLGARDHVRLTPQLAFTSGTQKFGFNQTSATYGTTVRTGANVLFNSENILLDDQLRFQPLSLTLFLRSEYSVGRFFFQPQFTLDYYFPAADKNLNALFAISAGFIL